MRAWAIGTTVAAWGLTLGLACGPTTDPDLGETDDVSTGVAESSGGSTTTATTEVETSGTTTGSLETDGGSDDDGETGCTFTCPPPAPLPPGGGMCNCPEGEKCMPWANDGSMIWNAIRCSPIAEDAGQPGDACTVEGSQWSGIDDCDYGAMCYGVDPETFEGFCISFCSWFGEGASCPVDQECQVQAGELGLPLCVPTCDPTAPECTKGMGCFASGSSFVCEPTAKMRAPVGAACSDPSACVAGALCAFGSDCDQEAGEGCCAEVCIVGQPNPCPGPVMCLPWFGEAGGPEWAHVGYCEL